MIMEKENQNKIVRTFKGEVVSDKMNKTIVVKVTSLKKHPKYKKYYKSSKRYKVHDENEEFHVGDNVQFIETNPISKDKRWKVINKLVINKLAN